MRTVQRMRFAGMVPALIDRLIVSTETRSNAAASVMVQSSGSMFSFLGAIGVGLISIERGR